MPGTPPSCTAERLDGGSDGSAITPLGHFKELEEDEIDKTPAPMGFPQDKEMSEVAYLFWNCSEGTESAEGRWAKGPTPDGKGQLEYLQNPKPLGDGHRIAPGRSAPARHVQKADAAGLELTQAKSGGVASPLSSSCR